MFSVVAPVPSVSTYDYKIQATTIEFRLGHYSCIVMSKRLNYVKGAKYKKKFLGEYTQNF
jgi:hypothetical protein